MDDAPHRRDDDAEVRLLGHMDGALTDDTVNEVLNALGEPALMTRLRDEISAGGQGVPSYAHLFDRLDAILDRLGRLPENLRFDPPGRRRALHHLRRRLVESAETYRPTGKPNPEAVFWPNPKRGGKGLFDILPVVENLGLVGPETPIGSAGSCFAMEIAYALQRRGFNYVVTEKEDDIPTGVMMGDYDADNPYARFPANWGLLFNTPSFAHLAEKAFGERALPRLLIAVPGPDGRTLYADPYREGVYFASPEAYEANYDRHTNAVREALLRSRVFVITLGLNECWEFIPDGSVLSRNPLDRDFLSLVRPRVLTVEENVAAVQRFIDVVRGHNRDFTVIVSVSPVPFLATTRADSHHVVTANAHSKAVLRVAAEEEVVRSNRDVHYFPSYETVTECTSEPWDSDQRHVSRDAVSRVMALFDAMFVQGETS